MVTEEDIKQMELAELAIRERNGMNQLHEENENVTFNSIEEVRAFYHCEPFDEFDKRFRSGN